MKKRLVYIFVSFLMLLSCFTGMSVSAEITAEQEILKYCLVSYGQYWEQGIPYMPNYFQNLIGWTNNKSKWNDFISKSVYPNRMYVTKLLYDGSTKYFYIINYDEIVSTGGTIIFKNFVVALFTSSTTSGTESMSLNVYEKNNSYVDNLLATNYSGFNKAYVSFSVGDGVVLDDGIIYNNCSLDETKKGIGLVEGLKNILTGKFSLVDVLFDTDASLIDNFNLLGDSFNGWLSDLIDINVETSSSEYNQLLFDLENNTQNSAYINNVSQDTLNQIRNTYQNMKNTFDNSVSIYSDNDNNYRYTTNNSNSSFSNVAGDTVTNFNDYVSNSNDDNSSTINNYFNTYIVDDGSSNNNNNNGGNSGSGSGCNNSASASIGDIVINNNLNGSSGGSFDGDFDISSFESLLGKCQEFLIALKTGYTTIFPGDVLLTLSCGLVAIILCRFLGR